MTAIQQEQQRLTTKEVGALINQKRMPLVTNGCIINHQPLAMIDGQPRCVNGSTTEFCDTCPMFPTRTWKTEQELLSTEQKPQIKQVKQETIEVILPFTASLRKSTNGQYLATIPKQAIEQIPIIDSLLGEWDFVGRKTVAVQKNSEEYRKVIFIVKGKPEGEKDEK